VGLLTPAANIRNVGRRCSIDSLFWMPVLAFRPTLQSTLLRIADLDFDRSECPVPARF
jgi:hypothetical protein